MDDIITAEVHSFILVSIENIIKPIYIVKLCHKESLNWMKLTVFDSFIDTLEQANFELTLQNP